MTEELAFLPGLHWLDAMPAGNLGLRRAISARYCDGRKINGKEAREMAEHWSEYGEPACSSLIVADQRGI